MNHFKITSRTSGQDNRIFRSFRTAVLKAVDMVLDSGVTKFTANFGKNYVDFLTVEGSKLISVGTATTEFKERLKEFKLPGRPTLSGWCRCQTRVELDMEATTSMLEPLSKQEMHYLIYMDINGGPLKAVPLPNVMTEVTAILAAGQRGAHVNVFDVAQKLAMAALVPDPPRSTAGLFLVTTRGEYVEPLCKRVFKGVKPVPYVRPRPMHTGVSIKPPIDPVADYQARVAVVYEKPRKPSRRKNATAD